MSSITAIARKAPVIATFDTHMLHTATQDVHSSYTWEAATYVEQPALVGLRERFIAAVYQAKTPKACVSGPFGYGKTASAIGLWNACQQAGILTLPPISCRSFAELAQAVYDWFIFTLPNRREEIDRAYQQFLTVSADSLARRDEREFGIPFENARAAIRDKLERGYLDFEDVSVNLVTFLERATELAQQETYRGLVVIIDELQQLIGNASKGVLVAFRQLIWGLRMREIHFGLIMTMDPDTERTLADRAGDILHRIKDDGLFLDIRHIYDREFPAKLWMQYVQAFELKTDDETVIDRPALEALGQLCERDDLSNGPRTVINVLQLAAERRVNGDDTSYSPLTLIDDFLSNAIRFDGDRGVVPALVAELLSFPYFQRSHERSQAVKLLAAFPRGCTKEIAGVYGLETALDELNDDLRGEFVTELEEGLTLIELQRVGRPANRLNMLLRRYWMQITDQQLFAEDAPQVFTSHVLPLIFQNKVHDLKGWSGVDSIKLTASGVYAGIIEGTSSTHYPLRRVALYVLDANSKVHREQDANDIDVAITFRLDVTAEATPSIEVTTEGQVVCHLAPARTSTVGLSGSLTYIEHYLSPHPISAAVVMSLLNYLDQENDDTVPPRDKERMNDTITRLQEWLLAEFFPQEVFVNAGFAISSAGQSAIKEFLYLLFSRRWPSYQALARYQQWETLMREYETALDRVEPAIKMGHIVQQGTKADIARLFNQSKHAGFESRAKQYDPLLKIESWRGNEATIRFVPHPAETELAQWAHKEGAVMRHTAYQRLRQEGFAAAEVECIIHLALLRGLVEQREEELTKPDVPTSVEVIARARKLHVQCEQYQVQTETIRPQLDTIIHSANQADTSHVKTLVWELDTLEQNILSIETQVRADTEAKRKSLRRQLLDVQSFLAQSLPDASPGTLENHLKAVLNKFLEKQQQLLTKVQILVDNQQEFSTDKAEETLADVERWREQVTLYKRWNAMAQRLAHLYKVVERLRTDERTLKDIHACIEKVAADAREVLATVGILELGEIGQFEAGVSKCEQNFQAQSNERQRAYDSVANALLVEVQRLLYLEKPPTPPAYNPENDEQSFQELLRTTALYVQRYITILGLQVAETQDSNDKKPPWAQIRKDILTVARKASNPAWLIKGNPPHLDKEAANRIQKLQQRIKNIAPEHAGEQSPRLHLVQALRRLPQGTHDVNTILSHINGTCDHDKIVQDLIHLSRAGALRLMVDLPEHADD